MNSIYKFCGYRDFDLDALAGSYLWFSKVSDFNDPFEGLYLEQMKFRTADNLSDKEAVLLFKSSILHKGFSEEEVNEKAIEFAIKTKCPLKSKRRR